MNFFAIILPLMVIFVITCILPSFMESDLPSDGEKLICFDMDGTITNLYGVEEWERRLRKEDCSPYAYAEPLVDMRELRLKLRKLQKKGWKVAVITWGSKGASHEYDMKVAREKREWLKHYGFPCNYFYFQPYGTEKFCAIEAVPKSRRAILFDDNVDVRLTWRGIALDERNILEKLAKL